MLVAAARHIIFPCGLPPLLARLLALCPHSLLYLLGLKASRNPSESPVLSLSTLVSPQPLASYPETGASSRLATYLASLATRTDPALFTSLSTFVNSIIAIHTCAVGALKLAALDLHLFLCTAHPPRASRTPTSQQNKKEPAAIA